MLWYWVKDRQADRHDLCFRCSFLIFKERLKYMFFQTIGIQLPDYNTVSLPKILQYAHVSWALWKHEVLRCQTCRPVLYSLKYLKGFSVAASQRFCISRALKVIAKFMRPPHLCRPVKIAVLHIVAGPYQAVRWQQEPKQLYSLSAPAISYKVVLYSHENWNLNNFTTSLHLQ
jgi:hypothetical protein